MRKILFTFTGILLAHFSFSQTTHPVTFSGFTFVPDTVTADVGDNVQWTLTSIHNVVEISQSTWMANGSTSNGGFSTPFGGGTVNFTTAGTYYYSCGNHSLSGMKGVVIVLPGSSIEENNSGFSVNAYPTRVIDFLTLSINTDVNANAQITVVNLLGATVFTVPSVQLASGDNKYVIDMSAFTAGIYFVRVQSGDKMKTIKVIR